MSHSVNIILLFKNHLLYKLFGSLEIFNSCFPFSPPKMSCIQQIERTRQRNRHSCTNWTLFTTNFHSISSIFHNKSLMELQCGHCHVYATGQSIDTITPKTWTTWITQTHIRFITPVTIRRFTRLAIRHPSIKYRSSIMKWSGRRASQTYQVKED